MIITQEDIIKKIAYKENERVATVRKIFKSAEDIIFDYLSSTPPTEHIVIRLFKGFSLKRKYLKPKKYSKGMFRDINCPGHITIRGNISKYFIDKVNTFIS